MKFSIVLGALLAAFSLHAMHDDMANYKTTSTNNLSKGYNAPARIELSSAWDFSLKGEFLIWDVLPAGNPIIAHTTSSNLRAIPGLNERAISLESKWRPGARVTLGTNFDHDCWTTALQWTYIQGKASKSAVAPTGGIMSIRIEEFNDLYAFLSVASISSSQKNHLQMGQVVASRPYYIGKYLVFEPIGGFRGGWRKDKVSQSVSQLVATDYDSFQINFVDVRRKRHFQAWYVGPTTELMTNWLLGKGFRIYGDVAAALMFARERAAATTDSESFAALLGIIGNRVYSSQTRRINTLQPMVDAGVGLGWNTYLDDHKWHIDLSAGYEFHYFFETILLGELPMHGATLSARLDF